MYPKMLFKCPGDQSLSGGKSYGYKAVKSEDDAVAAIIDGWFPTVPEAIEGKLDEYDAKQAEVADTDAATREELETKAKELGLKFDGRTSDAKLGNAIAAKLAE